MRRMKIYLAGPMRGRPYYNFKRFDEMANKLSVQGYDVISPADMDRKLQNFNPFRLPEDHDWWSIPEGFDLEKCVRKDVEAILSAEAIYLLDGWQESTGAKAEYAVAKWALREVMYESEPVTGLTADERKQRPVFSGVLKYFPDALMELANVSFVGNEQHNPGQPLHWSKGKSTDHEDAMLRHTIDKIKIKFDSDGVRHSAKAAWRALAALQVELEDEQGG